MTVAVDEPPPLEAFQSTGLPRDEEELDGESFALQRFRDVGPDLRIR